VYTKACHTTFR